MKILVIQTAFIGDAILATGMLEKLHAKFPDSQLDYMIRKGNESLFKEHPFISNLLIWDKKNAKYKSLWKLLPFVKKQRYDYVINLQRFGATGLFALLSKGKTKIGFDKNPFSFGFTIKIKHDMENGLHEIERNHKLIENLTDEIASKPKLYPTISDFNFVKQLQKSSYICMAPTSVWFTKQFPAHRWIELIGLQKTENSIYLLGAPSDFEACDAILKEAKNQFPAMKIVNLANKLTLLQSAALMKNAEMNFVNDSAPMHLCSAMNAAVTAIYCSTIPAFGFGPLSENAKILEEKNNLECRPCGLHGKKSCPKGHFKCAGNIVLS